MLEKELNFKLTDRNFLTFFLSVISILVVLVLTNEFYFIFKEHTFTVLHTSLDTISVALCFTVAVQGWLIFSDNPSDKRLRLAALFMAIALFDLMHINFIQNSYAFRSEGYVEKIIWFGIFARLTAAIAGIILIIKVDTRPYQGKKYKLFACSLMYFLFISSFIIFFKDYLPALLIAGHGPTLVRKGIEYLIISLHLISIVLLVQANKRGQQAGNLTLFIAMLFLLLGSLMFTSYLNSFDSIYLMAHILKVLGYAFLLKAVFYTVIEKPFAFDRMLKEEKLKTAEEFKKTIQILPNIVFKFKKDDTDGKFYNVFWEGALTRELRRIYQQGKFNSLSICMIQELSKQINSSGSQWIIGETYDFFIELDHRAFMASVCPILRKVKSDQIMELVGFVSEITEKRRMEEALQKSQEKFVKAFNASPTIMTIRSITDWRYIDVNETFLQVTGYTREEVINNTKFGLWLDYVYCQKVREHVLTKGPARNMEVVYRSKNGEERIGLLSADILEIAGERCVIKVTQDITEKKKLENEMKKLDRLNLVGEMAATIAHEIRNPMTTVRGFLQMIGAKQDLLMYKEPFSLMIDELDRANSIITEFLSLAKNRVVKFKEGNLNSVIKTISPLIMADAISVDKTIEFELNQIQSLSMDEKEIRQLILNLVRNGLEAMPAGKTLTLGTYTEADEVVLFVRDEGTGIEPELIEKIGTPFLTTKEKGTGLGLPVCFSIAARHNAQIQIDTDESGTTFYVKFKPRLSA